MILYDKFYFLLYCEKKKKKKVLWKNDVIEKMLMSS